jgi:activator of HSP90 ATPase
MAKNFQVSAVISATPTQIYTAWMDGKQHGKMTGSKARGNDKVGGTFEAWDGYITATNLELKPGKRILQAWRTVEFADGEKDSRLEVLLEAAKGGTKITIKHSDLPAHGDQYKQGWIDNYFMPMKEYFAK